MSQKIVNFYYRQNSLPHSEFAVIQSLIKFLEDDTKTLYKISTSTASIFTIVRAFCLKNQVGLVAKYEDTNLILDKYMRVVDWSKCPGFDITENALEILLTKIEE